MPTPLIVLEVVVVVFAFLLFMRVKVCVGYSGNFDFAIKYMFFTFRIKEPKKGQAKKAKKAEKKAIEKKKKKEQPEKKKFTFEQLKNFLPLFQSLFEEAKKVLVKVSKKIRIDKLKIDLTVGGGDAADVAITYGEACAIIYPAVSFLEALVNVKNRQVAINADFNGDSGLDFDCCASMRLGSILAIGIVSSVKILVTLIKNRLLSKGELQNE